MATIAELLAARESFLQAIRTNPNDFASRIKYAQNEAQTWQTDPGQADLPGLVQHLDAALGSIPPANITQYAAQLAQWVKSLVQNGMPLAPILQQGNCPRLIAALKGEAIPQGTPAGAVSPAPAQSRPAAASVSASPQPMMNGTLPKVRDIQVGTPTNAQLKDWMTEGKIEELTSAYGALDNFRTRRLIIDKVGESNTPMGVACLLKMMSLTHDDKLTDEITKKILALDHSMIERLLVYDPNDQKNKLAVVMVLAELKSESTVEPLTQALNDADYHVKVKAIDALAEMIEASPEWIEHLASIIKTEPPSSVKVRRAAALALQTIGTKESFQALDQVSRQCQFDEGLNKILAAMTEKFRGGQMEGRKQKIQEEKKKKAQERQVEESKFRLEPKMIGMFAMLIAFLGGLGFAIMLWAKSMGPQVPFKPEDIKPPPATIVKSKGQIKDFANKFNKLNK